MRRSAVSLDEVAAEILLGPAHQCDGQLRPTERPPSKYADSAAAKSSNG